jgi:hypothetical protein
MSRKDQRYQKHRKRGLLVWGAIAGLIALAIMYWRCGGGFGIGGGDGLGGGEGDTVKATAVDAGVKRCQLRLAAAGITVDGKAMSQAEAVAACKQAGGAEVVVTGDARQGDWDALRSALGEAGVRQSLSQP